MKHRFILQPILRRRSARREKCHVLAPELVFKMFPHHIAKAAYRKRIANHEHLWCRWRRGRLLRPLELIGKDEGADDDQQTKRNLNRSKHWRPTLFIDRSWGIALHPGREYRVPARSGRNRPSILPYSKSSRLTGATEARRSGRFEISRVIAAAGRCKPGASPVFVSNHTRPQSLLPHRKRIRPEILDMALTPLAESVSFWKRVWLSRSTMPSRALHSARPRAPVSRLIR